MSRKNDTAFLWPIIALSLAGILYFGYRALSERRDFTSENPFEYDVESLEAVDPALLDHEEADPIPLNFTDPGALAVDGADRLHASGDGVVRIMDPDGRETGTFRTGETARCMDVGADGRIYLGMADHVVVYDRSGTLLSRWDPPEGTPRFTSIAVAGDAVYAADAGNRIVRKYAPDGTELLQIGGRDETADIPGFIVPSPYFDVAIDPDGFLWAVNPGRHSLENYTPEGGLRTSWGAFSMDIAGFFGCCNPTHLAVTADGTLVTAEKGVVRIKVYAEPGRISSVAAGPGSFADGTVIVDIAVDSRGRIFALDPVRKEIRVFVRNDMAGV